MEKTITNNPVSTCYGVTNKCHDNEYVLFADYDGIYFHTLLEELRSIHAKHKKYLTNFAIFESTESILTSNGTLGSYHVVSFAKLPYHKMREILQFMSVDDDFYALPKKTAYRSNTLRISPKFKWDHGAEGEMLKEAPKFVTWFPEERYVCEQMVSLGHLKAYSKFVEGFNYLEVVKSWVFDVDAHVELKKYCSGKG